MAAGLLALGGGCLTPDGAQQGDSKKPDVTKPGVLPPPQETMKGAAAIPNGIVPAGGTQTGAPAAPAAPTAPPAPAAGAATPPAQAPSPLAKLLAKTERKGPQATEMAVAWRNRIGYLPDPSRNGAMGPGIAGQLFLYGPPNLQPAVADGTLTVDLVDETPRPPGQPAATPERWQFDKVTLQKLRTVDETWGKSYMLFLPWPAYKSDITKVRIAVRYDPDHGHTLYSAPSVLTIDTSAPLGAPVWDGTSTTIPGGGAAGNRPLLGGMAPTVGPIPTTYPGVAPAGGPLPMPAPAPVLLGGAPIPLGGAPVGGTSGPPVPFPPPGAMPTMPAPFAAPAMPVMPPPAAMPAAPLGPVMPIAPGRP
jgi:hypothetical protein